LCAAQQQGQAIAARSGEVEYNKNFNTSCDGQIF